MCDPVSLGVTTAVMGVGSAVAGASSQASAAGAQGRFQNARYKANAESALGSYRRAIDGLSLRDQQESAAATAQAEANYRQGITGRSRAAVMAAAAGTSGRSLTDALNQFSAMEHENDFNIWRNREWQRAQMRQELEGARANAQSQISGAAPAPIQGVNYAALGLQIGGSVLGGFNAAYGSMTDDQKKMVSSQGFSSLWKK